MIDGVYSMYGDFAPIQALYKLLQTNKKFHLYADDAHGMGWIGKRGQGYILSQVELHPKLILATSLNKAFGAGGGVFVFYDREVCERVKNCGTSFIFSAPHSLPVLGAAIESARIFLSDEIYEMQAELSSKVRFCQELLEKYNLPVISNPETPIFFIGLGLVRVGYNMVKRIMNEGCFASLSSYPAVPETCTGLRFTITLHHTYQDIEKLVKALAFHLPKALEEEERTMDDINKAFRRMVLANDDKKIESEPKIIKIPRLKVQHETCIDNISKEVWDSLFRDKGNFNWNTLKAMESSFSNNIKEEHNWKFHYYIIRNEHNIPLLATFFTVCLIKDDMLAPASISSVIEDKRVDDPYYFTSKSFMMGSMVTEGDHLYLNRNYKSWKKALMLLLDTVWKEREKENASVLFLRDFNTQDSEICEFFKDQGFIKYKLPDTHVLNNESFQNRQSYYSQFLDQEKRYYFKRRVQKFEEYYDVDIIKQPDEELLKNFYQLYLNVATKNLDVNGFVLPEKLFKELARTKDWEFISLSLKEGIDERKERLPIGVAINFRSENNYHFILTGIDYNYLRKYNIYPQILWQVISRAKDLELKLTTLGFTASQNKRKTGACAIPKVAFLQFKDDFNFMVIETMPNKKVAV